MGYTIATPVKSEMAKCKMMAFLKKNFRHFPELEGRKKTAAVYYYGPIPNGKKCGLSYDSGKCRIGFDYNASGYERDYIFTICRWIALKVGRLYTFPTKNRADLQGDFPVIVYDGDEATDPEKGAGPWPILLDNLSDEQGVDQTGCKLIINPKEDRFYQDLYGYDGWELIRKEMKRLNSLWE